MDLKRPEKRYDIFSKTITLLKDKYRMSDVSEFHLVNAKREDVPFYFNAASLHLLTSDFEGSPNTIKESLSCNTPVVATDVGNAEQMIGTLKGCSCAENNNPELLEELIFDILKQNRIYKFMNHII